MCCDPVATQMSRGFAGYTGCQGRRKPAISPPPLPCGRRSAASAFPSTLSASLVAMDSFELNKILGAILGTCLGVLTINIAAGAIFTPAKPAKPGYEIAVPEKKDGAGAKPAEQEKQR